MPFHPILPLETAAAVLHGKACRHSLGVSRRVCTEFPQLFNLWAIPKEMPLLLTKVADLRPGLSVRLLHFLQLLGLCITLLLQFLQLLFLGHRGNRIGLRALLNIPQFPFLPSKLSTTTSTLPSTGPCTRISSLSCRIKIHLDRHRLRLRQGVHMRGDLLPDHWL